MAVEHRPLRHAVHVARLLDLRHRERSAKVISNGCSTSPGTWSPPSWARIAFGATHRAKRLQEVLVRRDTRPAVRPIAGAPRFVFAREDVGAPAERDDEGASRRAESCRRLIDGLSGSGRSGDGGKEGVAMSRRGLRAGRPGGYMMTQPEDVVCPDTMSPRSEPAELKAKVGDAGYTPAIRDAPGSSPFWGMRTTPSPRRPSGRCTGSDRRRRNPSCAAASQATPRARVGGRAPSVPLASRPAGAGLVARRAPRR